MTQLRLSPAPLPQDPASVQGPPEKVTHFVNLPEYLDPSDLEFLLQCREPRAVWEVLPQELVGGDVVEIVPGTIRLSPHAVVHGPYAPLVLNSDADREVIELQTDAVSVGSQGVELDTGVLHLDQKLLLADPETLNHPAGFPSRAGLVWALTCSKSRGEAPMAETGDRDGLARVFAEGQPVRDEWRQVVSLVAIARFLGGTAHFDAAPSAPMRHYRAEHDSARYRSVEPDPAANVDLTVYSDVWLEPQAALSVARSIVPELEFLPTAVEWDGPASDHDSEALAAAQAQLEPDLIEALREQADEFDIAALSTPVEHSTYGLIHQDRHGDVLCLEVAGTQELPPILEGVDWAQNGIIEYRITWLPHDEVDWQREIPSFELRQRRTRVAAQVRALARAIYAATSGEVADQDGFLRDPLGL